MSGMYETVGGQIEPPIPRSPRSPLHRPVRSPLRRSVTPFRRDSVLRCFAAPI